MKDDIYKLGKNAAAKQEYDIARMLESELSHMDLSTAVFEIIDNALDETPKAQNCEMVITFDAREKRIVFENRNTSGMDPYKLQNFVQWGQEHADATKLKEHGQGGKLGMLFMLSKESGSLYITSQGAGAEKAYHMNLGNWWKNLAPGKEFAIEALETDKERVSGFTRMILEGTKTDVIPTPSSLAALADRIGFTYSPLIRSRRLSVKLLRLASSGKLSESYSVLPIDIPFDPETTEVKKNVPVDQGSIKMNVSYGMIDISKRVKQAEERKGYYGVENVFEPYGERVRIFFAGKLLDEQELSRFASGRSRRMAFYNFAVIVDITEGFVEKTILKTGLSKSSPKTAKIYESITKIIEPYVTKISKDSDTHEISLPEKRRVDQASTTLGSVLLRLHENDLEKIREEFNLPTTTASPSSKERGKTNEKPLPIGTKITTLPGIRGKGDPKVEKKVKVSRATNPIPKIDMVPMGKNFPNATLNKEEAGNKLVVLLNYDSPDVKLALKTKGTLGVAQLVRIAAWAIYHEKWISVFENNVKDYIVGVQSDVAELLSKAEEFKII